MKAENADEAVDRANSAAIPGSKDRNLIDDHVSLAMLAGKDERAAGHQGRQGRNRQQRQLGAAKARENQVVDRTHQKSEENQAGDQPPGIRIRGASPMDQNVARRAPPAALLTEERDKRRLRRPRVRQHVDPEMSRP